MVIGRGAHCLVSICYLTANTHYNSGALIPECNDLSQFREDTGLSVPVREINPIAYPPLVQPTEKTHADLDLNPGHCRSSASQAQQALWLRKCISPLSHGDRPISDVTGHVIPESLECYFMLKMYDSFSVQKAKLC